MSTHCRRLAEQLNIRTCSRTRRRAGIKIAIRTAIMALTTNSSMSVNPLFVFIARCSLIRAWPSPTGIHGTIIRPPIPRFCSHLSPSKARIRTPRNRGDRPCRRFVSDLSARACNADGHSPSPTSGCYKDISRAFSQDLLTACAVVSSRFRTSTSSSSVPRIHSDLNITPGFVQDGILSSQ